MKIFYSAQVNGFFTDALHTPEQMPADVKEIPPEHHRALMAGQTAGKRIGADELGEPALFDRPLTLEQILGRRARLLAESDWTQLADVPEATRDAWAIYRQELRDLTDQAGFPDSFTWPVPPTATTSETE